MSGWRSNPNSGKAVYPPTAVRSLLKTKARRRMAVRSVSRCLEFAPKSRDLGLTMGGVMNELPNGICSDWATSHRHMVLVGQIGRLRKRRKGPSYCKAQSG
ncbi:uncharacterized protein BDV14DRAFT_97726 [Aspergillus stella-maris]|uniref:uncharacterized protein n=1 Tax=Aspergillus stella-maris TaxID=1810926 RepID=UPI003CCDC278